MGDTAVLRAILGGNLNRLGRGQPGLDQQFQLGLQGEAGHFIGTGHDRHARLVQQPDELHHFRVRGFVALQGGRIGDFHGAHVETALHVGRHMVGDGGKRGVQVAILLLQEGEGGQRRIDHRAVLFQPGNEVLDGFGTEIEAGRLF